MTLAEAFQYFEGLQHSFVMGHCCGQSEEKAADAEFRAALQVIIAGLSDSALVAFMKQSDIGMSKADEGKRL